MKNINYIVYRLKYLFGRSLLLKSPVDISLELSSFCNMMCTYCYHNDKKKLPFKQNFMSWDTAKLILTQAAALNVPSVKMNWRGESSMNPEFSRVCKYAKQLSTRRAFIDRLSNSNFKFDNNKDEIFEGFACQTKVKISYDSFKKDVFEKQRLGGNHDITTANIDKFYNWPGRETEIVIQAVRTQRNKDEDFEGEIKKRWPSAGLSVRDVVEGRLNKDISDILVKKRDVNNRQSCLQAHVRLIFDTTGRASPCCPDIKNQLVVGDIHEKSLYDIFNSQLAKQLREDLKSKKAFEQDPCKNCSSHETFKGYKPSWTS
jgi:radical SAM protein with 4Fe4S-binding SPASM domain